MFRRLLHGALLGALLAALAGLAEVVAVLVAHPYHRDPALWLAAAPLDLAAGALLGVGAALLLPLLAPARKREALPGPSLAAAILGLGAAAVAVVRLHLDLLPPEAPSLGVQALALTALVGAAGLLLARLFLPALTTRRAWRWASLLSPAASMAGIAGLLILGALGRLAPVLTAPQAGATGPPPPAGVPNVLLVVLDTVRADHLGCYGYHRATSPRLDRIAAEGVVFENAFAAAPWTLPSHASLFTGLHPSTHRTGWEYPRLGDTFAGRRDPGASLAVFHTLAGELTRRGWQTCGISEKAWITYETGLTRGFQRYWDHSLPQPGERLLLRRLLTRLRRRAEPPEPRREKGAGRIVDRAVDWLAGGRGRDPRRPFFLFLNLNEAHDPFRPPLVETGRFLPAGVTVEQALALDEMQTTDQRKRWECGDRDWEPREAEILQALYDDEIHYQDQQLGRVFQALRDLDLMEDTLVVVTADHGEEFGDGHRLGHQFSLSDALLRVPLILRFPEALPAGTRVQHMASLVDVYPTILEFLERQGAPPMPPVPDLLALEGVSLLGSLGPEAAPARDFVLASYANPTPYLETYPCWSEGDPLESPLAEHARSIRMLRTASEKVLEYGDGERLYIHLPTNPEESPDAPLPAAAAERRAALLGRLHVQSHAYRTRRLLLLSPLHAAQARAGRLPANVAPLEQLGYVGSVESRYPAAQVLVPPPFLEPGG